MKRLIAWFARNGVAANLLMLVIMAAGILIAPSIRQEVFPEFGLDRVLVSVAYPGATPGEIEESINVRIEERVASLEGAKRITSTASEGVGSVTIEALGSHDIRELLADVKSEVDAIDTFPDDAEEPDVRELSVRHHVVTVAIAGDADELALKQIGERVRDDLSALPEITQVELTNTRAYEISVEVSERTLRRHGLTLSQVADAIRRSSLDLPGGSVKTSAGEILLRTRGRAYHGHEFEQVVVLTRPDGTRLELGDVATVVDGFAETDTAAQFDGRPAVMVEVFRVGEQSALAISAAVQRYVGESRSRMPDGVSLITWDDETSVLRGRLDTLRRNGVQGLILVFLTLALFLQFRLALWVSLGIPISFLGALALMPPLEVSINVLSLFSFILVLGIVVDDAIVIGENVYKKREEGLAGYEAAVTGAQEVAIPVIFGVLTTVTVFAPMLLLPGIMGKIMYVFPAVVIPTLLFSLVESQLILPSHLKHVVVGGRAYTHGISAAWVRFQQRFHYALHIFIDKLYAPALESAVSWRYTVAACAVALLLVTTAMVATGHVRIRFFPNAEADNVVATLTMPQGTPYEITESAIARLESAADQVATEFQQTMAPEAGPAFRHVFSSIGAQPFGASRGHGSSRRSAIGGQSHLAEVNIELTPAENRTFKGAEVVDRWRELTGPIPDSVELLFSSDLFAAAQPIDIELSGPDVEVLRVAANRLKSDLGQYPGVSDIADSFRPGKVELEFDIKPAAEALGVSRRDLARQVRQAFYGEEAQVVQRGREDVSVYVRFPRAERRSVDHVQRMRIRTPDGSEVPFSAVANIRYGRSYESIQRADRRRTINVTAEVDRQKANPNEILIGLERKTLEQLESDYPGLHYSLEGEQREQRETFGALMRGLLVALLVIYALIAIPLGSYIQPLIVLSAIPFGIVGAIWAHVLLDMDVSFMSLLGIVALVGVVVNDSLVLVDYVNRRRAEGVATRRAALAAGSARFRPILLTSLTTFAGLTPLLLERSLQAQFLIPMAVSLGFGVLLATVVSLVVVPCIYVIIDDLDQRLRGSRRRRESAGRRYGRPVGAASQVPGSSAASNS